jgi:hypothetical protein
MNPLIIWIVGITVTLLVALCDYLLGWGARPTVEAVHRTIALALTTLILTAIVDLRTETDGNIVELRAEMNRRLNDLSPGLEATNAERLRATVLNLLDTDKNVVAGGTLEELYKQELRDFDIRMKGFREGHFHVDMSGIPRFMMQVLPTAKKEVLATSYVDMGGWWEQPWGEQYQKANLALADRHVKITRLFIFNSRAESRAPDACSTMQDERKHGIAVKVALKESLPRNFLQDVIVIDETLAGRLELTENRSPLGANFYADTYTIDSIKSDTQSLLLQASDFTGCATK